MLTIFAKMLHHRLFIGFPNMLFGNTFKKNQTFKGHHFVSLFLSCKFYFAEQIKKCVTERKKKLNFEVFSLSIFSFFKFFLKGPNIYDIHMAKGREVLKFVTCLQILLFSNNRSIVNFCRQGVVSEGHSCMIPNIKTYFDKKVTFLALMPVLQWSSHPHFLIYV